MASAKCIDARCKVVERKMGGGKVLQNDGWDWEYQMRTNSIARRQGVILENTIEEMKLLCDMGCQMKRIKRRKHGKAGVYQTFPRVTGSARRLYGECRTISHRMLS